MNTKLLVGFAVVIVLFLALPLISKGIRMGQAASELKAVMEEKDKNAPKEKIEYPPIPDEPPLWNAANLPGTAWEVPTEKGVFQIEVLPDGVAIAYPPPELAEIMLKLIGSTSLQGSWSINYDKLTATVSAMGRTETVVCDVRGDGLYYKGMPIPQIQ